MYKQHFGLKSSPFKLTPDIQCFYTEGNRKAILQGLIYAVRNGDGITKVVGEVGSGKTLLSRLLAQSLSDKMEVLYLLNPRIPPDKIYHAIALELGLNIENNQDKVELLHAIHFRLLELHRLNKQTVLLIDEAQAIPLDTLEEIRMLSNLETGSHKLMQIVLFGQPELDQNLKRHEIRQIKERIIHSFYLHGLTTPEVTRYLDFRLQKAGYQGDFPFSMLAVKLIAVKSDGFLRRINVLADKCLLAAFSQQTKKINSLLVLNVIFKRQFYKKTIVATGVLVVSAGLFFLLPQRDFGSQLIQQTQATQIQEISPTINNIKSEKAISVAKPISEQNPVLVSQTKNQSDYAIRLMRLKVSGAETIKSALTKIIPTEVLSRIFFYSNKSGFYHVYIGHFVSYSEAKSVMQNLPTILQDNKPYIMEIAKIVEKYQGSPGTL